MLRDVRVAIVGGGVVGASVAFHLSQHGYGEIDLLEKSELSSGSTWHAAGLCPQTARSVMASRVLMEGPALFEALETETGQGVGFHRTGGIRVATTLDRADELRFLADRARSVGLSYELIGPTEVAKLWPLAVNIGIVLGLYTPTEGHVDPSGLTAALAKAAASRGVTIRRRTRVEAIKRTDSGSWLLRTNQGDIRAETVINATGQWARDISAMVGAALPMVPVEHQYVVTAPIAEVAALTRELPLWREPDASFYVRQEHDALVIGGYEQDARVWSARGIPAGFDQQLLPPDLDRIEVCLQAAMRRIPTLPTAGIRTVVNGPDGYTPDNRFLLGELPGLRGFFVVAAFNSLGIVSAVGAGKMCAEWVAAGEPTQDVWPYDLRRFAKHAGSLDYVIPRVIDNYARHTAIHHPDEERPIGRPLQTSGVYDRLSERGAMFGERLGWERPLWFNPTGVPPEEGHGFRRPAEFHFVARECDAIRNFVGVIDQTSFGKYEVSGPGATGFLDSVCSNRMPAIGRIRYTLLLSERGGIMGELTITRLESNRYYVVAAAGVAVHHLDWLQRYQPDDGSVQLSDLTGRYGVLSVMGPRSRALMERVSDADFGATSFRFLDAREVSIGMATALALRVSFVGELGWEIHHRMEFQRHIYDKLMDAGGDLGIVDFGYRALNAMGLEKAYPVWGEDLTPAHSPLEAGLERFVDPAKGPFVGREAFLRDRNSPVKRRLVSLAIDDGLALPRGGEPVIEDGRVLGHLAAAGYGYTVGQPIGRAYLPIEKATLGCTYEVQVLQETRRAVVVDTPYDVEGYRLRG